MSHTTRNHTYRFAMNVYSTVNARWFDIASLIASHIAFATLTWTFAAWLARGYYDKAYGDNPQKYPEVGYPDRPGFWQFGYAAQEWILGGLTALGATVIIVGTIAFVLSWIIERFYYCD